MDEVFAKHTDLPYRSIVCPFSVLVSEVPPRTETTRRTYGAVSISRPDPRRALTAVARSKAVDPTPMSEMISNVHISPAPL